MKWLLILLMCWVLPTAKIQEEEINMAIPSVTPNSEITDFNFFIKKIYKILGGNL